MAEIEHDVMGGTRKVILERQEQAAKEQEKIERQKWLDERYAEARRLYRAQDWRAAVEVFTQIRAEDPTYSDPEGLLNSARQALQRAEEEDDVLQQYHGAVQSAWADRELDKREVETLREIALEVKLNSPDAARVEREVMGDEKEAVQRNHYRKAVGEAKARRAAQIANKKWWQPSVDASFELGKSQAEELRDLADKLGLGTEAAKIEREILGVTIQALLKLHQNQELFDFLKGPLGPDW